MKRIIFISVLLFSTHFDSVKNWKTQDEDDAEIESWNYLRDHIHWKTKVPFVGQVVDPQQRGASYIRRASLSDLDPVEQPFGERNSHRVPYATYYPVWNRPTESIPDSSVTTEISPSSSATSSSISSTLSSLHLMDDVEIISSDLENQSSSSTSSSSVFSTDRETTTATSSSEIPDMTSADETPASDVTWSTDATVTSEPAEVEALEMEFDSGSIRQNVSQLVVLSPARSDGGKSDGDLFTASLSQLPTTSPTTFPPPGKSVSSILPLHRLQKLSTTIPFHLKFFISDRKTSFERKIAPGESITTKIHGQMVTPLRRLTSAIIPRRPSPISLPFTKVRSTRSAETGQPGYSRFTTRLLPLTRRTTTLPGALVTEGQRPEQTSHGSIPSGRSFPLTETLQKFILSDNQLFQRHVTPNRKQDDVTPFPVTVMNQTSWNIGANVPASESLSLLTYRPQSIVSQSSNSDSDLALSDLSDSLSVGTKVLIGHSIGLFVVVLLVVALVVYLKGFRRRRSLDDSDLQRLDATADVSSNFASMLSLGNWTLRSKDNQDESVFY